MKMWRPILMLCGLALANAFAQGQQAVPTRTATVRMVVVSSQQGRPHAVPAVAWLEPIEGTEALSFPPGGRYTLMQKNRTFLPHLQVIPVGSVVQFPNADPFFHNVFSLFDGKRFDLGLYEAGTSKAITFSREGVSYIFCNIHPEMSAVILSLSTPLYAVADTSNLIVLHKVPAGEYRLQVWVEGVPQSVLTGLSKRVQVGNGVVDLGEIHIPSGRITTHENKFGKPYEVEKSKPY